MKVIAPMVLVLLCTAAILFLSSHSSKIGITAGNNTYINFQINYQLMLLGVALTSMAFSYYLNPESFTNLFSLGNISAVGEELKVFGIAKGDSWLKTGVSLSIFISIVTAIFLYFQLKEKTIDYSLLKTSILWILLFSLSNSFSEEMIYRLGINGPLTGLLKPNTIFFISAIIFGVAHIQGMPSGIVGILLAGILGYVLSKSVHETSGIFWAWFIHFIQDILIISTLYLLNSKVESV